MNNDRPAPTACDEACYSLSTTGQRILALEPSALSHLLHEIFVGLGDRYEQDFEQIVDTLVA